MVSVVSNSWLFLAECTSVELKCMSMNVLFPNFKPFHWCRPAIWLNSEAKKSYSNPYTKGDQGNSDVKREKLMLGKAIVRPPS